MRLLERAMARQRRELRGVTPSYSNKSLISAAADMLQRLGVDTVTPEEVIARLRSKWSVTAAHTRKRRAWQKLKKEEREAEEARQLSLFTQL